MLNPGKMRQKLKVQREFETKEDKVKNELLTISIVLQENIFAMKRLMQLLGAEIFNSEDNIQKKGSFRVEQKFKLSSKYNRRIGK